MGIQTSSEDWSLLRKTSSRERPALSIVGFALSGNLMRKILLFGSNGQLGAESQRALAPLGEIYAVGRSSLDIADLKELRRLIKRIKPDLIFNASAYTLVDEAETKRGHQIARRINVDACRVMAEEALSQQALLVHFSTDYVFDGRKNSPYIENDIVNPLNVYGETKLEGERAIQSVGGRFFIFRTSWVYSKRSSSFVGKVLSWARSQKELRIVDDQIGSPTWASALAQTSSQACLVAFLRGAAWSKEKSGIYHLGGRGHCSRKVWAEAIIALDPSSKEQVLESIVSAKTDEYPGGATRPLNSSLNCEKFETNFGLQLQEWKAALKLCMRGIE